MPERIAALLLACLACLAFLAACSDSTAPVTGTLSGTVSLLDGSAGPDDVLVVLMDDEYAVGRVARVAAGGDFAFENLPAGPTRLYVMHESYVLADPSLSRIVVRAGQNTAVDLRLLRNANFGYDYRITGRVTDAVTGAPVAGAWIASTSLAEAGNSLRYLLESSSTFVTVSDETGYYSLAAWGVEEFFEGPVIGLSPFSCGRRGYRSRTFAGEGPDFAHETYLPGGLLPVPADSNLAVDIALEPVPTDGAGATGAVRGLVLHDGVPQPGVSVTATLMALADRDTVFAGPEKVAVHGGTVLSADDGSFVLDLQPGSYALRAGLLPDDGWLSTGNPSFEVVPDEVYDVGEISVRAAIAPLSPTAGSIVGGTTPVLSWTPSPGADRYRVSVAVDMYRWNALGTTTETQIEWPWGLPAAGESRLVRWQVHAETELEPGYTWSQSWFEQPATFTMQGPEIGLPD